MIYFMGFHLNMNQIELIDYHYFLFGKLQMLHDLREILEKVQILLMGYIGSYIYIYMHCIH